MTLAAAQICGTVGFAMASWDVPPYIEVRASHIVRPHCNSSIERLPVTQTLATCGLEGQVAATWKGWHISVSGAVTLLWVQANE